MDEVFVVPSKPARVNGYITALFCLLGCLPIVPFNFLMNSLPSLRDTLQFDAATNTTRIHSVALTTAFNGFMLIGSVVSCFISMQKPYWIYAILALLSLCLCLFTVGGILLEAYADLILSSIAAIMALCSAFLSNKFFSLSAQLEPFMIGTTDATQAGLGTSGVIYFALWELFTLLVFRNYTKYGLITRSLITMTSLMCVFFVCGLLSYMRLMSTASVRAILNSTPVDNKKQNSSALKPISGDVFSGPTQEPSFHLTPHAAHTQGFHDGLETPNITGSMDLPRTSSDLVLLHQSLGRQASSFYGSTITHDITLIAQQTPDNKSPQTVDVIKFASRSILRIVFTYSITCTLFPNLTPLSWSDLSTTASDLGMGMYQFGTFAGRSLPLVWRSIHKIPRIIILAMIWGRILFIIIYYVTSLNIIVKMIYIFLLAFSSAVLTSLETVHAVTTAHPLGCKTQIMVAKFCVIALSGGILVGSVLAIILV